MKKESNSVLGLKWELETRGGGTFLKIAHSERRMRLVSSGRHNSWRIIGTYCRPCALAFEMLIVAKRRRVNGRRLMTDRRRSRPWQWMSCQASVCRLRRRHAARICAPCALLPVIDVAPIAETPSLPRGVYKSLMEPRERGAGRERMKRED